MNSLIAMNVNYGYATFDIFYEGDAHRVINWKIGYGMERFRNHCSTLYRLHGQGILHQEFIAQVVWHPH